MPGPIAAPHPQHSPIKVATMLKDDPEAARSTFALREDVVLLVEPDGAPHRPSCISHAPLLILRGTTLTRIKEDGDWAMVASPSQTLGWVPMSELLPLT